MTTYAEIIDHVRANFGFSPKTCWIADVKADYGLTRGVAPNRKSSALRLHPCPPSKRAAIERALAYFGLIARKK